MGDIVQVRGTREGGAPINGSLSFLHFRAAGGRAAAPSDPKVSANLYS